MRVRVVWHYQVPGQHVVNPADGVGSAFEDVVETNLRVGPLSLAEPSSEYMAAARSPDGV